MISGLIPRIRFLFQCCLVLSLLTLVSPITAQQLKVDVKLSDISDISPHPTTYVYYDEVVTIQDPGAHYYTFFYTGQVNPDARVPTSSKILRIPIPVDEWSQYRQHIITRLTEFYRGGSTVPVSDPEQEKAGKEIAEDETGDEFVSEYDEEFDDEFGDEGFDDEGFDDEFGDEELDSTPTPTPTPVPATMAGMYGMGFMNPAFSAAGGFVPPVAGGIPGVGAVEGGEFNPKAAAEWTFYYDQLVLWQYYCARVLLDGQDKALLEDNDDSSLVDGESTSLAGAPGTAEGDKPAPSSFGSRSGDDSFGDLPLAYQSMMDSDGELLVREVFDPIDDHENPDHNRRYHQKYVAASKDKEEDVYTAFMDMINEIDARTLNQAQYEEWLKNKRQEVLNFAEDWRQAEEGDTLLINDTLFIITEEPLDAVPIDAVNVIRGEQVTPQDLLNDDGSIKTPTVF